MEETAFAAQQVLLQSAFERFTEASSRLEERYEALRQEALELRQQLQAKERLIKQSERLATLGRTAAALAHEVRNPLGAIRLFVSLLKSETGSSETCQELIGNIERGIETLNGVVTNILQFSRRDDIVRAPVNLTAVVREQIAFCEAMIGHPLHTTIELHPTRFVLGDAARLGRVFLNLFLNALQAGGKEIAIRVAEDLSDPTVIRIAVEDSGPGIPKDLLDTLFEPFVTTRSEGVGLGLAVVRLILEQHGGSIAVSNCPGARFTLTFPRGEGGGQC